MYLKRLLEIFFTGTAILILSPLLLLIALALKMESRGPTLYKVKRVNRNNKVFTSYRFRTTSFPILNSLDQNIKITRIGRILRKSNLDYLPQLYNVITGEMSLFFPTDLEKDSISLVSERSSRPKIITFFRSLKFLIPKKLRIEIIDLYDQTKADIQEMRLDMFNDGLPLWWVDLVVLGNILSVILGALLDCIKRFFSLLAPLK